jgi:hypothetical protein
MNDMAERFESRLKTRKDKAKAASELADLPLEENSDE